jgi:hypothetical protein
MKAAEVPNQVTATSRPGKNANMHLRREKPFATSKDLPGLSRPLEQEFGPPPQFGGVCWIIVCKLKLAYL